MAKQKRAARRVRRQPDATTVAAALERARLRRLVTAKRDVVRLVRDLERATIKAESLTLAYAKWCADAHGARLVFTNQDEATPGAEASAVG